MVVNNSQPKIVYLNQL